MTDTTQDQLWATLIAVADYLDIEPEQARHQPGKPSDVYIKAIQERRHYDSYLKGYLDCVWNYDIQGADTGIDALQQAAKFAPDHEDREQQLEQSLRDLLELFGDFEPATDDPRPSWSAEVLDKLRQARYRPSWRAEVLDKLRQAHNLVGRPADD